jgi:ATP-dependent phosphoenolpyruvate carboxykinase
VSLTADGDIPWGTPWMGKGNAAAAERAARAAAQSRIKVRVVCARAYHALFMYNMLIRPTAEELASFGKPDFTIFNAGAFPVNRYTSYMSSSTSIDLNLKCGPTRVPRLG